MLATKNMLLTLNWFLTEVYEQDLLKNAKHKNQYLQKQIQY